MKEEEYMQLLGENIRQIRLGHGFSRTDIAFATGMEESSLIRIEAGRTNPTTKTLKRLADALNVEVKDLFDFKI